MSISFFKGVKMKFILNDYDYLSEIKNLYTKCNQLKQKIKKIHSDWKAGKITKDVAEKEKDKILNECKKYQDRSYKIRETMQNKMMPIFQLRKEATMEARK